VSASVDIGEGSYSTVRGFFIRPMPMVTRTVRLRPVLVTATVVVVLVVILGGEVIRTAPVREAVASYTALLAAANRQDLVAVRRLCTARYLREHPPIAAPEGGVVGLPRNVHPNFQAWKQGPHVWLCPTNRVGPLYQFVREGGRWRFDGPIGLLRARHRIELERDPSDSR
jgi:hypothetical protein